MSANYMPLGTLLDDVAYQGLLTPSQRIILRHLIDAIWPASLVEMMDALYGHREDGGPIDSTLRTHIDNTRKRLRPSFFIECFHGMGWRLLCRTQDPEET